jgi:nitroreductase
MSDTGTFHPALTPYNVKASQFPGGGSFREKCAFLLNYAILAPSTHNTQPWKFMLTPEGVHVFADYSRRLPAVDPQNRELLMSVGAAIFTLRAAACRFGFSASVRYNYSGDSEQPLAVVRIEPREHITNGDFDLLTLFPAIVERHTNRRPFLHSRIPESVLALVRDMSAGSRAALTVSTDGKINEQVGDMVAAAERIQFDVPEFRADWSAWLRRAATDEGDGIPGDALGMNPVSTLLAPWAVRTFRMGNRQAAIDRNLCVEAPGLVVIHSEDNVPHWLEAGELLQKLLLTMTREGLHQSYFNIPVQVPELRQRLRTLMNVPGLPQAILRIGYSLSAPVLTPRRPLRDVVLPDDDNPRGSYADE